MKNKLIEGSILRSLIHLSVPIIITNILQTAYQITDTFWVGRLGSVSLAAVSISFPVIFLIIALGGGVATAGTILVAQYAGKKDEKKVNYIATQTLLISTFISIFLAFIGYFFSPSLIKLMGVEKEVLKSAVSYMKVSFIGVVFIFIYIVFQSLMRGVGEVKIPMYIILGTVLLNFILDPLFIFGYKTFSGWGVTGAAFATIITQGLAMLTGLILLLKGKYQIRISISLDNLKPNFQLLRKIFILGFPASIEQCSRALGMVIISFLVAGFNTVIIAAYGIGSRVLSFIIIPASGLAMATSTLVGQNIGAGKIKRAEKIAKLSALINFVVLSLIGMLIFLFAKQISAIFAPSDLKVIQESSLFIRIIALTFGFIGLQMSLNGLFRGSGNTIVSMILSLFSLWVLRIPLAYILSHTLLREIGLWLAFPITNLIAAFIYMVWFLRGSWKKKQIIENEKIVRKVIQETIINEGIELE